MPAIPSTLRILSDSELAYSEGTRGFGTGTTQDIRQRSAIICVAVVYVQLIHIFMNLCHMLQWYACFPFRMVTVFEFHNRTNSKRKFKFSRTCGRSLNMFHVPTVAIVLVLALRNLWPNSVAHFRAGDLHHHRQANAGGLNSRSHSIHRCDGFHIDAPPTVGQRPAMVYVAVQWNVAWKFSCTTTTFGT